MKKIIILMIIAVAALSSCEKQTSLYVHIDTPRKQDFKIEMTYWGSPIRNSHTKAAIEQDIAWDIEQHGDGFTTGMLMNAFERNGIRVRKMHGTIRDRFNTGGIVSFTAKK